jgi:hypothetical protein
MAQADLEDAQITSIGPINQTAQAGASGAGINGDQLGENAPTASVRIAHCPVRQ